MDLESPYIRGRVKAACMTQMRHGVTLGSMYAITRSNPTACREKPVELTGVQVAKARERKRAVAEATELNGNILPGDWKVLQNGDAPAPEWDRGNS